MFGRQYVNRSNCCFKPLTGVSQPQPQLPFQFFLSLPDTPGRSPPPPSPIPDSFFPVLLLSPTPHSGTSGSTPARPQLLFPVLLVSPTPHSSASPSEPSRTPTPPSQSFVVDTRRAPTYKRLTALQPAVDSVTSSWCSIRRR